MVSWLDIQRRQVLRATPFSDDWLGYLQANIGHYALLSDAEQERLRNDLRILVEEISWHGCANLTITEEIQVAIAGQACLLLLGHEHDYFSRVPSVYVYPTAYGHEGHQARLGEAWMDGPVVLAWDEVQVGGQKLADGRNVVLHEFAHQLDFLDGLSDGRPPMKDMELMGRWHEVMRAEYNQLVQESERGRATLLDQYGALSLAEFFAVATECFFEKPVPMRRKHPLLYGVLGAYFRQDTAQRFERKPGRA